MSTILKRSKSLAMLSAATILVAGGLAGCSSGPELRIDQAPTGAVALSGIGFITKEEDERALGALKSALTDENGIPEGADWHIVTTLAVRPADVGTYSDVDARDGEWAETPRVRGARREPGLHVLTAVATRADGSDTRVARVSGRGPVDRTPDALLNALAKLAADALIKGEGGSVEVP